MIKNLHGLLQNAGKMQAEATKMQEILGSRTVEADAGAGMVKAVVNGKQEIVSLLIEDEIIDTANKQMLVDLITAAVNEGIHRSKEMVAEEMNKMMVNSKLGDMLGKIAPK